MTQERLTWDQTHMTKAYVNSLRGTCPRLKVGCVFVKDNRVISEGYNGAPSGFPHCEEIGCDLYWYAEPDANTCFGYDMGNRIDWVEAIKRCRRAIHAEKNGVGYAARNGIPLAGSSLYVWPIGPCPGCALDLVTVGLAELIFPQKQYIYDTTAQILKDAGVTVRTIEYDPTTLFI